MKPKILCSQCNALLTLNVPTCPSCGAVVEWPSAPAPVPERSQAKEKRPKVKAERRFPAPVLIGLGAVVVFVIAVVLEQQPSAPTGAAMGAPNAMSMPPQAGSPSMQAMEQIEMLETKVKANPADVQGMLQLANILHDNRFYERAISYYTQVLAKTPKDVNARVDMGICLHELGRSEEAVAEMKKALKEDPRHIQAHFNMGIIHLSMQDLQESNVWFKKTVELAPGTEIGNRAQQLLSQHKPQQFK